MKRFLTIALVTVMSFSVTNCATVFDGPVSAAQKRKPAPGEPQRSVKVGWLIADIILFAPGLIVDFATGAIYKK